jgi:predicted dehydrogenase
VDEIRVGVVGVGALGQHHARLYAKIPGVKLIGVADSRPGRAKQIAEPLGTQPFLDYRVFMGKVDAVSIATPTTTHAEIGEQFLREGIHVLVEKPISHSLETADRLIAVAAENGKVLQVGHLERFNPAVRALRELVKRPRFFEAHRMGLFSPRSLDIDVILDLMIHDLDLIKLLVPSEPVQISAVGIPILTKRIDIANARIQFADGCVANVTASRVSMEKIRKLRLFQAKDYVSMDFTKQEVAVFSLSGPPGTEGNQITSRHIAPPKQEPLEEELKSFIRAVRGQGPVECTGVEGRNALDLALQILNQAEAALTCEFDTP